MKFYLAPMEGITGYIYRNAYHRYFRPMDKYFTPFLSPGQAGELRDRDVKEILPENNPGLCLVPQLLTNRAEAFLGAARLLAQYGYREVNLNLGCPSGTVAAKKKGAGFLGFPEELDQFLEAVCRGMEELGMELSIKTRLGRREPEEFSALLEIYKKYPIKELIIHPRVQKDFYKNTPNLEAFALGMGKSACPVCYNGDITSAGSLQAVSARFPELDRVMIGRGVLADPFLLERVEAAGKAVCMGDGADSAALPGSKEQRERLRRFHDALFTEYRRVMSGDRNVLFKMKELWSYLILCFQDDGKYLKKIGKARTAGEYEAAVTAVFGELDLRADGL